MVVLNYQEGNTVLNDVDLKPIPGYENLYWASPKGYVTNGRKVLKTYKINSGYHCLKLHGADGKKAYLLHRLIAITFLDNPQGKAEVNHRDGDKGNNALDNLEWVTSAENKAHARATGLSEYNFPTKGMKLGKSSKYRHVGWDKDRQKWHASIRVNGRNVHQRRFDSEVDAARHVNWIIDTLGLTDRVKNDI